MENSIIDKIDKAIKDNEDNAIETLNTIKTIIANERKPNFNKIKDGEHFFYKGIEFVRLGKEQVGGILCVTAKIWKRLPFDRNGHNHFYTASICKELHNEFYPLFDNNDLITYQMDLTADNGDKAYGGASVFVGLLSANLYRKYRDYIPQYDGWIWLSTPWCCDGYMDYVRVVNTGGVLNDYIANTAGGVVPVVVFKV